MELMNIMSIQFLDLTSLCLLSATTGLLSHALYFIHFNFVHSAVRIAVVHLIAGSLTLFTFALGHGITTGAVLACATITSYLAALFTSIGVYRLFLHPTAHFPGPLAAKLTKFYGPWIARNGQMHLEHKKLAEKYGNVVRIGPNELMITSIDAIQRVHGAGSRFDKRDTFFDATISNGVHNLNAIPNSTQHGRRRLVWDKAMNSQALERYEDSARRTIKDWLNQLATKEGQPIDTSLHSLLLPFDNIGRVGYSHEFGLVKQGKESHYLNTLESHFGDAAKLGQMPWPIPMIHSLKLSSEAIELDRLSCQMTDNRLENDSEDKEDIVKYFIQDMNLAKPKAIFHKDVLYADSAIILVGGTDTIAAALSYSFFELGRDASLRARLRAAVSPYYGKTFPGDFSSRDLEQVSELEAFINEVLRMYNPTCSNGLRTAPPEGATVDGVFIPGGTHVLVPIHTFQRSKHFFVQPDTFIPERWTSRPELVLDRRAFHPFLIGPRDCVGKRVALSFIRLVLASTLWHYDFEFAPGERGVDVHAKAVNQLILKAGPLRCVFRKRVVDNQ